MSVNSKDFGFLGLFRLLNGLNLGAGELYGALLGQGFDNAITTCAINVVLALSGIKVGLQFVHLSSKFSSRSLLKYIFALLCCYKLLPIAARQTREKMALL